MSFLLDTNVVSEWLKPQPNPGVVSWLATVDEDQTCMSVVTITELRYGMERLSAGSRKRRLEQWLHNELLVRFEGRILPVDLAIADECGRLVARSEAVGHPIEPRDAFIAATALVYGLTLATRNVSDFRSVIKNLFVPWTV
ncbi:MAG: type II toxin-antitoxin system VapC family toxin [Terriglobales bacterium]